MSHLLEDLLTKIFLTLYSVISLHKNWSFPLGISSVNETKSAVFTEEILNGKLHFGAVYAILHYIQLDQILLSGCQVILLEILGSICILIICFLVCDVINFEINVNFLSNRFP